MVAEWRVWAAEPERASSLAAALGIHPLTAQLLLNRGVREPSAAGRFLSPGLSSLGDPWALAGLEPAVRRIQQAITRREVIGIFSDSDVDGLTAGVILSEALEDCGARVCAWQANRIVDGYGLPRSLLVQLSRAAVRLLILVDCGTNQAEEVTLLAQAGIETIIVDHHLPQGERSLPAAMVNPHCVRGDARVQHSAAEAIQGLLHVDAEESGAGPSVRRGAQASRKWAGGALQPAGDPLGAAPAAPLDGTVVPRGLAVQPTSAPQRESSAHERVPSARQLMASAHPLAASCAAGAETFASGTVRFPDGTGRELCSAGLAFKLAQALVGAERSERWAAWLDLAALGTLADYVPLVGDSRALVAAGLPRLSAGLRPGLARLCEATRTAASNPDQVIRRLAPRLNASGRLGDAQAVWHLLRREADPRLERWLSAAAAAHATTKQLHRRILAEANEQVSRLHFRDQFVVVISREGWHQGVMGPLAARLAERCGRPAITLALNGAHGTGSGRSIPLFNLFEALRACQRWLVRFGGHAQACGLTVGRRQVEPFRAMVNEHASAVLGREGLRPMRVADLECSLGELAREWVAQVQQLAPFGPGNPRPTLLVRRVILEPASPRTAQLSDGIHRVAARGAFAALLRDGPTGVLRLRCDVLVSPAVASGELVLTVSDVKAAAGP
jgi:single-stranded DNA-specific DHH superfamily exonuclease